MFNDVKIIFKLLWRTQIFCFINVRMSKLLLIYLVMIFLNKAITFVCNKLMYAITRYN